MIKSIIQYKKSKLDYPSKVAKEIREILRSVVVPGITTMAINNFVEETIFKKNCVPGLKGYKKYPFSSCISVNSELCHGLPSRRVLNDGDIVNVDFVVEKNGWFSDTSETYPVGKIGEFVYGDLIKSSIESTFKGIEVCGHGVSIGKIAEVVNKVAKNSGFFVVKEFCGHGIGKSIHEEPQIIYDVNNPVINNVFLKAGDVVTMEPIIAESSCVAVLGGDGWVYYSNNGCYSALCERTIIVTDSGCEILN